MSKNTQLQNWGGACSIVSHFEVWSWAAAGVIVKAVWAVQATLAAAVLGTVVSCAPPAECPACGVDEESDAAATASDASSATAVDRGDADAVVEGGAQENEDASAPDSAADPREDAGPPCVPTVERCDGVDNNCDGQIDEGFTLAGVAVDVGGACTVSGCGAGVVECANLDEVRCSSGPGGSTDSSESERCDGIDNDCDGDIDEDYGVGNACQGTGLCSDGVLECASATDTRCSTNYGGSESQAQPEICDGLDNDCDGVDDNDLVFSAWYLDCDGDGYADGAVVDNAVTDCKEPNPAVCGGGWTILAPLTAESRDCNDGNADVFPGQERFFDTAILGAADEDAWDYNCDEAAEPELAESYPLEYCVGEYGSEDVCNGFGECGEAVWSRGYPVCGQQDSFIEWRRFDLAQNRYVACTDRLPAFAPQRCR